VEARPENAPMLGVVLVLTGMAALWTVAVLSDGIRRPVATGRATR
jgi:hypothetical protein